MTTLDCLIGIGDHPSNDSVADRAVLAEELGFDRVSFGETTGWNIVPALTLIGDRTETVGVSCDVMSPFGRSPAMLGQTALALHDATDGRFRLGLGPSSPAITERWHGADFDRPLRRLRETVEIIRALYANGSPAYEGEIFDIAGLKYENPVPEDPPAIDISTLGPKATELAGFIGEGWVPQLFTPDGLRDRLGDLERGAEKGDRSLEDIRVSPIVRACALEDGERARDLARQQVGFMLGAYGPYYGNSVAEQGYPDIVEELRAAWEERDTATMAAAVSDELLDDLAAAGSPEEVRAWLEDYGAIEGVDAVRVGFVAGMGHDDRKETMRAIAELT